MNSVRLLRRSASSRAGLTDRSDYEGTTNYAAECSVREQLCCFFLRILEYCAVRTGCTARENAHL